MPLITHINDNISIYGSGHTNVETPFLEDFLVATAFRSLYLERDMGKDSTRVMKADAQYATNYANRNGIFIRHTGYAMDEIPKKLAIKYPVAVVVAELFGCLNNLVDSISNLQTNGGFESGIQNLERERYRSILRLLPDNEAFTKAVQQYLKDIAGPIITEFIRPNIQNRLYRPVLQSINEMEGYISNIQNILAGESDDPLFPIEVEDIAVAHETDLEGIGMLRTVRDVWKDYKRDWQKLSDDEMFGYMRRFIKKDHSPIGIVVGFQHVPGLEGRISRLLSQS